MKKYMVSGPYARFMSGVLRLTEEQYRSREHALDPLGDGRYRITAPTGFKRGEVLGFDGEVNKDLLQDIVEEKQVKKTQEDSGMPVLEYKVEEIKEMLPKLPEDDLPRMLATEMAGRNRKGVLNAIKEEMELRAALRVASGAGNNE